MGLKCGIYMGTNDIYGIAQPFFDILRFTHFSAAFVSFLGPRGQNGPKFDLGFDIKCVNLKISKNGYAIP